MSDFFVGGAGCDTQYEHHDTLISAYLCLILKLKEYYYSCMHAFPILYKQEAHNWFSWTSIELTRKFVFIRNI